jgi:hypothetical protein
MTAFKIDPGPGRFVNADERYGDNKGIEFGDDADASIKSNGSGATVTGVLSGTQIRVSGGHNVETLTGAHTLASGDPVFQKLDPGGAGRDVNLPAEASSDGLFYVITNAADAAENLTVKDDGASTIVTISQNEQATVVCNGTSWVHMGIVTIALS